MSLEAFYLFTYAIAGIGLVLSLVLCFGRRSRSSRLLAFYTLALTICFLEPVATQWDDPWVTLSHIVIGISSFLLGPSLYLYCRQHYVGIVRWNRTCALHFFPVLVVLCLMVYSFITGTGAEEARYEVLFYALFVLYLMTYTVISVALAAEKSRRQVTKENQRRMESVFPALLAIASLTLFTFSVFYTLMGLPPTYAFVVCIQLVLFIIIIGISFLNPELSERHFRNFT